MYLLKSVYFCSTNKSKWIIITRYGCNALRLVFPRDLWTWKFIVLERNHKGKNSKPSIETDVSWTKISHIRIMGKEFFKANRFSALSSQPSEKSEAVRDSRLLLLQVLHLFFTIWIRLLWWMGEGNKKRDFESTLN